jgi:hypothetical protein
LLEIQNTLEARSQMRLMSNLGPCEVPKRREPMPPDRGTDTKRKAGLGGLSGEADIVLPKSGGKLVT